MDFFITILLSGIFNLFCPKKKNIFIEKKDTGRFDRAAGFFFGCEPLFTQKNEVITEQQNSEWDHNEW